jgi:hypothetical protein
MRASTFAVVNASRKCDRYAYIERIRVFNQLTRDFDIPDARPTFCLLLWDHRSVYDVCAYSSVANFRSAADMVLIITGNNGTGSTYLSDILPGARVPSSDQKHWIRVSVGGGPGCRAASEPASRFFAVGPKSSRKREAALKPP